MAAFDSTSALIIVAALLSVFAGMAIALGVQRIIRRKKLVVSLLSASDRTSVSLFLNWGARPLRPLAQRLLHFEVIDKQVSNVLQVFESRGFEADKEAALSLTLAAALIVALAGGLLSASIVCGIALGCCAIVGVLGFVHTRSEKESLAMRENIPDALRSMSTCFRSGLSLVQTLRHTSQELDGSLGDLLGVAARRLEMGSSVTEALSVLRNSRRIPELVFIAVALDVQHQSGGSIVPVLDAARESVESELSLLRSLRVQTAQAKLSARIVTVMPFVLAALFSLMSPDFLAPFFTSALGIALLLLALGMECAGIVLVRRMLRVDVG